MDARAMSNEWANSGDDWLICRCFNFNWGWTLIKDLRSRIPTITTALRAVDFGCPPSRMIGRLVPFLSRSISFSSKHLKQPTAYEAKLAARKPPPPLLESDLEENFIKGCLRNFYCLE
jgi:hypothetical protein